MVLAMVFHDSVNVKYPSDDHSFNIPNVYVICDIIRIWM